MYQHVVTHYGVAAQPQGFDGEICQILQRSTVRQLRRDLAFRKSPPHEEADPLTGCKDREIMIIVIMIIVIMFY